MTPSVVAPPTIVRTTAECSGILSSVADSPDERRSALGGEDPPDTRSVSRGLSIVISVGAVALAAAHLIWPRAKLDSVTVVLVLIALLPWLGVIFESIQMPGGWQFDYRKERGCPVARRT
jgi:hypothetical protein